MIHNVLLTSMTPLNNKNEINCWENRPFTTVWPENIHQKLQKTRDITITIKKKQRRVRTAFSREQLRALERAYSRHKYIDAEKRIDLAKSLNIGEKCIKIWFQNRRMKEKRESESSCDTSSESVGNETPPMPASPPLQVTPIQHPNEYINKFSLDNNTEQNYQLPTYYHTNQNPSGYASMPQQNFATYFYNDNNIYPTQYYPYELNFSNGEGNGFNQYGSEMNNCWSSNHYPYYSTI